MIAYWNSNQRRLAPWLFLAPGMAMFLVYVIIPIFQSMWLSFYDWDGLGAKTWIGTANYVELFDDEAFTTSLWNNVIWLVLFMLAVPIGLMMAIFLNQTVRGIRIYKSLFFFPFVISQVVVGLMFAWFYAPNFGLLYQLTEWVRAAEWRSLFAAMIIYAIFVVIIIATIVVCIYAARVWLLSSTKAKIITLLIFALLNFLFNYFKIGTGATEELFNWFMNTPSRFFTWPIHLWESVLLGVRGNGQGIAVLADETYVNYGIIAAGLWPQIAYVMILYLTGLNNVAPDQIEAARLDGARGWKMLWYVIIPQLRPATFIAVVVTVIGALRSFDLVSIMTAGGPYGSSRVLSYYMYEQALSEYGYRMGYGAAIAVVLFGIMMIFISGFIWKMWRDETER